MKTFLPSLPLLSPSLKCTRAHILVCESFRHPPGMARKFTLFCCAKRGGYVLDLSIFQVDAFAAKVFEGNPAAICPLEQWLPDEAMQAIASENNLSETAFFVPEDGNYALRWFTPHCEVDLCGHATLASGFVLLDILAPQSSAVRFKTRSGILTVCRDGDLISMDFPALPPWQCSKPPDDLARGLSQGDRSAGISTVFQTKNNYFVIYEDEKQVQNIAPNFEILRNLHPFGVCITASGEHSDFVSRYFAPSYGIPEDPVTGSTHSSLVPYWSGRLNQDKFHSRQLSKRTGDLWCEARGQRVILKGHAVLYLTGSISI
jgi:PhzF family phenazine biosynthesis protein